MKRFRMKIPLRNIMLAGFLAALICLCLTADSLELTFGLRADLSFNALTTPSVTTKEMLSHIRAPVQIITVFKRGNEDMRLYEILNRYRSLCRFIQWEQTDLAMNPSLVARFQGGGQSVTDECVIVYCPSTDRFRVLRSVDFVTVNYNVAMENYQLGLSYEKKLSEALLYVTRQEVYHIAILQGHHELDENMLGYFTAFLSTNGYDVSFVNLQTGDELPAGSLLMILSPVGDLWESELLLLNAFAADGGAFFITSDPADPIESMPNFASLLRLYGFIPIPGMAVASAEEKGTYYDAYPYILIPELLPMAMTAPLILSDQNELWLLTPRAFEMPEVSDVNIQSEAVAVTGAQSYIAAIDRYPLEKHIGDRGGPFALALLSARMMESTYLSRAFIIGNSTLLTDPDLFAVTDCGAFLLTVAQYLLDQSELLLPIDSRPFIRPGLSAESVGTGTVIIIALPALVAAAAIARLMKRRGE